jgi:hypothetical protein
VGGVTQKRTLRPTFASESRHHRAPLHTQATLHRGLGWTLGDGARPTKDDAGRRGRPGRRS